MIEKSFHFGVRILEYVEFFGSLKKNSFTKLRKIQREKKKKRVFFCYTEIRPLVFPITKGGLDWKIMVSKINLRGNPDRLQRSWSNPVSYLLFCFIIKIMLYAYLYNNFLLYTSAIFLLQTSFFPTVGGHENISIIDVDYRNFLQTKWTTQMKLDDTSRVLEYIRHIQSKDPYFFYAL